MGREKCETILNIDAMLRVLYLPPFPPSITYRPWASGDVGFSPLAWFVERLVRKYGPETVLIACQDEFDQKQAEQLVSDAEVFVVFCKGQMLIEALGDIAR